MVRFCSTGNQSSSVVEFESVRPVLSSETAIARGGGDQAEDRRDTHGTPLPWVPADKGHVELGRIPPQPEAGSELHAGNGNSRDSSGAKPEQSPSGSQPVSLPSEKPGHNTSKPCLGNRYHIHPPPPRLDVSGGGSGLVLPIRDQLGTGPNVGNAIRSRGCGKSVGHGSPRNLQQRPGEPLHHPSVYRSGKRERGKNQHGRAGEDPGQCVHRALVAKRKIRGGVFEGIRFAKGSAPRNRSLPELLQYWPPAPGVELPDAGKCLRTKNATATPITEREAKKERMKSKGNCQCREGGTNSCFPLPRTPSSSFSQKILRSVAGGPAAPGRRETTEGGGNSKREPQENWYKTDNLDKNFLIGMKILS